MNTPEPLRRLVAPQAWVGGAVLLGLAAIAFVLGWPVVGGALVLLTAGHVAFFRNPRRAIPPGESLVVSPGDGRVVEIAKVHDAFVGDAVRIAIFLSVFNVHINRAPLAGKIRGVRRSGSKFLAAWRGDASDLNVQLRLDLESVSGARAGVVQITGLIARRIVSYVKEGDSLDRGTPYGLICYGSRMELYLPADVAVRVAIGDKVKGGLSVLAELRS